MKEYSKSTDFQPLIDGGREYNWGIHSVKPAIQKQWDKSIAQAAELAEQCHPYIYLKLMDQPGGSISDPGFLMGHSGHCLILAQWYQSTPNLSTMMLH